MSTRHALQSLGPLSLLDRFIGIIELSETQNQRAKTSYTAVTDLLKNADCIAQHVRDLDIKAQGSMRAGTTIKPQNQHVFDLDVLCVVEPHEPSMQPRRFLDLMWDALGEHATYRDMRVRKDRCIRLEYKGDFHLDITPAKPAATAPILFVPDKNVSWSSTNPIGFCDQWFLPSTRAMPILLESLSASNTLINAKRAAVTVEALPDNNSFDKRPLQRIVQLVKYDRDNYYGPTSTLRPSSILLTTIVTKAYNELVTSSFASMRHFVLAVLQKFPAYVEPNGNAHKTFSVPNPVNQSENFAEKWDADTYAEFHEWHEDLMSRIHLLLTSEPEGVDNAFALVENSFPEAKKLDLRGIVGRELRTTHDSGSLMVKASPLAILPSVPVKSTIFYGEH